MKKTTIAIALLLIISGCANKPQPAAPEPEGEFTPVNPDNVHLSELKL